jgi:hypothetical protein
MFAACSDRFSHEELTQVLCVCVCVCARARHAELLSVKMNDTHSYRCLIGD